MWTHEPDPTVVRLMLARLDALFTEESDETNTSRQTIRFQLAQESDPGSSIEFLFDPDDPELVPTQVIPGQRSRVRSEILLESASDAPIETLEAPEQTAYGIRLVDDLPAEDAVGDCGADLLLERRCPCVRREWLDASVLLCLWC